MKILGVVFYVALSLAIAACSHQSKIKPSNAHIDVKHVVAKSRANLVDIPNIIPSSSYPLPPQTKASPATYSVVVNEVPIKEILFALARDSQLNVDIHPALQGKVTLNAIDQTLPAILERLSKQVDLAYRMQGNVLFISPDMPELRTYKVDYVNINRDTTGFIGSASEIATTGRSATVSTAGTSSTTTSSNGTGSANSSRTAVNLEAKHHLWETLIQNLKDLLAETDKEIMVSRFGSASKKDSKSQQKATEALTDNNEQSPENVNLARNEYKTLLAATVIPNPETGIISIRATARQHARVQEFLDKVLRSAKKQVLIEATIVEVTLSDSFQSGIDWSRLNDANSSSGLVLGQSLGAKSFIFNPATGAINTGQPNALGITGSSGFIASYINPVSALGNIAASITLLKQFGDTKVLSSPKLMVLNNQTAMLKVVDNLVYFTIQSQISQSTGTGNASNLQSITTIPNTVPVGVVMSVTPQINDSAEVSLDVRPTISRVLSFVADPNPQLAAAGTSSLIPQIQVREMESVLNISSGNTAILGGLMQDEIKRNSDAVPGLSQLPAVGKAFKANNDANKKTELVIFLRPTVIANASLDSDELRAYQQYLPQQQLQQTLEQIETAEY